MLARRQELPTMARDPYEGLVPQRLHVLNEVVILLVLQKENRWLTAFEVEKGAAKLKGDESIKIQVGPALRQLYNDDLVDSRVFEHETRQRKVTKYQLTQKGAKAASLYYGFFQEWPR